MHRACPVLSALVSYDFRPSHPSPLPLSVGLGLFRIGMTSGRKKGLEVELEKQHVEGYHNRIAYFGRVLSGVSADKIDGPLDGSPPPTRLVGVYEHGDFVLHRYGWTHEVGLLRNGNGHQKQASCSVLCLLLVVDRTETVRRGGGCLMSDWCRRVL